MLMQVKEEEEYLEWLKGQKQTLSKDKSIAAELVSLASFSSMAFFLLLSQERWHVKINVLL